jgi:hypothetical protein
MRRFILALAIVVGAHATEASCERATKEESGNCLHWANLNLDWSPQLKRRRDEIIARIGQHFYAWREYGEGFTVLGIIDHDSVRVKYDHHLSDDGIHAMFAEFPSQEWTTKNPYASKEGIDRREVATRVRKAVRVRTSKDRHDAASGLGLFTRPRRRAASTSNGFTRILLLTATFISTMAT